MNLLRLKTLRDNTMKDYPGYRLIGDVDLDGMVTDRDVSLMYDAMNGKITLNEIQFKNADIDGDGKITINDIAKISNWLIGGDNYVVRWIPIDAPNPKVPDYPLTFHDYRFPQAAILDPDGVPYYQSDKQFVIVNDTLVEMPYEKYSEPIAPEPVDLPEPATPEPVDLPEPAAPEPEENDIIINGNLINTEIDSTIDNSILPAPKTVPISIDEPIITEPIKTVYKNYAVIKKGNDIRIYEYDTVDNLFKYLDSSGYQLLFTTSDYNYAVNYISNLGITQSEPVTPAAPVTNGSLPLPIPRPIPVDTKPVDTKPVDTKPIDTKPIDIIPAGGIQTPIQTENKIMEYIPYVILGLLAWKLFSK